MVVELHQNVPAGRRPDDRDSLDRKVAFGSGGLWEQWWKSSGPKNRIIGFVKKYYFNTFFASLPLHFGPKVSNFDILMELGSGQAGALAYIRQKVSGITIGLDLSMEVALIAAKNCDYFVCGDIFHLPFEDKSADVIFNQGVIEHFTDKEISRMFKEFERVCRKKLVVCVPSVTSFFRYIYNPFKGLGGRFMSKNELLPLMREHFANVGGRYLLGSGFLSMVVWGEVKS